MSVIPAFQSLRQEDEFNLGNVQAWGQPEPQSIHRVRHRLERIKPNSSLNRNVNIYWQETEKCILGDLLTRILLNKLYISFSYLINIYYSKRFNLGPKTYVRICIAWRHHMRFVHYIILWVQNTGIMTFTGTVNIKSKKRFTSETGRWGSVICETGGAFYS